MAAVRPDRSGWGPYCRDGARRDVGLATYGPDMTQPTANREYLGPRERRDPPCEAVDGMTGE